MKNIFFTNINEVGKQKVPLKAKQGMSLSKTPAPKSEKIYGSNVNKKGSSSSLSSAKNIKMTDKTITSIKNLVKNFNKKNPNKKITVPAAKAVVRRGMGAYSSTHRPTITGGKPNSRVAWGLARLKAFLYKAEKGKSKSGNYVQDDDLFKELGIRVKSYETGGELEKGIKTEKEHSKTIHDIYTHKIPEQKAFEAIAKDHIKENPNYYSNMKQYAEGGLVIGGVEVNNGDTGVLTTRKGDINITIKNITENWVIFIDEDGKRKDNPRDKFIENFTPSQGGVLKKQLEPKKETQDKPTKPQKTSVTFEPEIEPPVYFDKEADFTKVYENYLQNNQEITDYNFIAQSEVLQNIFSNFEISVENLKQEVEEIKNKPVIKKTKTQTTQKNQNLEPITIEYLRNSIPFSFTLEFNATEKLELRARFDLRIGDDTMVSPGEVINGIDLGEMYCVIPGADMSLYLINSTDVEAYSSRTTILSNSKDYMEIIKEKIETKDYIIYNQEFSFEKREIIECEVVTSFKVLEGGGSEEYSEGESYDFIDIGPYLIFTTELDMPEEKVNLIPKSMVTINDYGTEFYDKSIFEDARILEKITNGDFFIAERT
jgi:hypothetical protein